MTEIILPNKSRTKADPILSADWYENDVAIKEVVEGELTNANLSGSAGITAANLAAAAKPVTWYTPKVIATEESRTNTAFGTLTTADEIKEVVLPTNGLIMVSYRAAVKSSVASAGRVALYLGSNIVRTANGGEGLSKSTNGTEYNVFIYDGGEGLISEPWLRTGTFGDATTGQIAAASFVPVFAAAGTYTVSVQFRATSGSVTAKERKLWVYTLGV